MPTVRRVTASRYTALDAELTNRFHHARDLVARSGIGQHANHEPTRRSRPSDPAAYSAFGVVTTQLWLTLCNQPTTATHVFTWLWTPSGFTDDEMAFLCLPHLRPTADRFHLVNTDAHIRGLELRRLSQFLLRVGRPCHDPECPAKHY